MCGKSIEILLKEWNYSRYHVKCFKCDICLKSFKAYYNMGKFSHIIDNSKYIQNRRILHYLRYHSTASTEEIADALHLSINDVLSVLTELEKDRKIEKLLLRDSLGFSESKD